MEFTVEGVPGDKLVDAVAGNKLYKRDVNLVMIIEYLVLNIDAFVGTSVLDSLSTMELVVIAISCAALVWMLVGLILVCYRHYRKQPEQSSFDDSPRSEWVLLKFNIKIVEIKITKNTFDSFAMLYKNDDFCEFDTGRSTNSRKSIGEQVKEWWRQRFKICPGGCDKTSEKETCIASVNYYSKESLCTNPSRISYKYWFYFFNCFVYRGSLYNDISVFNLHRRRKKKYRSVSTSASPSSSPCVDYTNKVIAKILWYILVGEYLFDNFCFAEISL